MEYSTILVERADNFARITLNRPDKLNALNRQLLTELDHALDALAQETSIAALIITGSGEKAFAAGADISELQACFNPDDAQAGRSFAEFGQSVFNKIEDFGKPVIAAVNGFALGGGCELALACHLRFASDNAKFGQPEVNLGIIPGYGGTQRLTHIVGRGRAVELILTGAMVGARDAEQMGLVNDVVDFNHLQERAEEFVDTVSSKGQEAVSASLKAILFAADATAESGLAKEAELFGQTCTSDNFREGTAAFLEKRKANFSRS